MTGKKEAGDVHFQVGQKVRQTIAELGGTMPENLPTPQKGIKQIEREEAKRIEKTGGALVDLADRIRRAADTI